MKPRFRLSQMSAHPTYGFRLFLEPINTEAYQMIRDRDNGTIEDFGLVLYQDI
jgi:hypothetical protein